MLSATKEVRYMFDLMNLSALSGIRERCSRKREVCVFVIFIIYMFQDPRSGGGGGISLL